MSRFNKKAGGSSESSEGGRLVFVRPSDLARANFTGVVAEGTFDEAITNQFNEEKDDFKIVADTSFIIKGEDSKGEKYETEVSKGDTVVVNGAGNLGYLMKEVSPGTLCQISYQGKNEIKKGPRKGTLAHSFEVLYS